MDILYYSMLFAAGTAVTIVGTVIAGYIYGKIWGETDPLGVDTDE